MLYFMVNMPVLNFHYEGKDYLIMRETDIYAVVG